MMRAPIALRAGIPYLAAPPVEPAAAAALVAAASAADADAVVDAVVDAVAGVDGVAGAVSEIPATCSIDWNKLLNNP